MIFTAPPPPAYEPPAAHVQTVALPANHRNDRLSPASWSMWSLKGDARLLIDDRVFRLKPKE